MANRKRLILEQLTDNVNRFSQLKDAPHPVKGWIRAIREALGMSGVQFAKRLGVSPQRVATLEKAEVTGAVTIRSMRQAAEALDCVFVYALVPRSSLKDTVRRQALEVARERLKHTSHTMLLEDQQLSKEKMRKALDAAVEELVDAMPKELWDKPG
ncbi:MAG: mobile mystery protein A [Candidatus Deferrimicrobiota bacterium]